MKKKLMVVIFLLVFLFIEDKNIEVISAKVKTLYEKIQDQAVLDNIKSQYVTGSTGIDFSEASSVTNGKGIYTIATTKDNKYPIHYYRGEVNNNWVVYAGYCWKIVRTTDTGGIKILYSGKANENGSCNSVLSFEEDLVLNYFHATYDWNIGYMYGNIENIDSYTDVHTYDNTYWAKNVSKNKQEKTELENTNYYYSDKVNFVDGKYTLVNPQKYQWQSNKEYDKKQINDVLIDKYTCFSDTDTDCESVNYILSTEADSWDDNINYISLTNGETYDSIVKKLDENNEHKIKIGSSVVYQDGKYKIQNSIEVSLSSLYRKSEYDKIGTEYKYSCMNNDTECDTVHYLYNIRNKNNYYTYVYTFKLSNNEKITDFMNQVLTNNVESDQKKIIDEWYEKNLDKYGQYLEDTIWCNDRSIVPMERNYSYDGTMEIDNLSPATYYRYVVGKPNLSCTNKNDSFTVDKTTGNGLLKYPIGLLTSDEALYAGSSYQDNTNSKNYLSTKDNDEFYRDYQFFLMSPYDITFIKGTPMAMVGSSIVEPSDMCAESVIGCDSFAIRPMVSLKNDTVCAGEGTVDDPCVIGETEKIKVPQTGDNILIYLAIGIGSMVSMLVIFLIRKRLNN